VNCHCCQGETKKFGRFQNRNRTVQRYRCIRCGKTFSESQPLDGIRTDAEQSARVVELLCEGVGIRATARLTGLDQKTILRILQAAGEHALRLLDAKVQGVKAEQIQVDELWSFVRTKQFNAVPFTDDGDQYVYLATDRASKLIISHVVGRRTHENTYWFMRDLQGRMEGRFQLSSDAYDGYTGKGRQPGMVAKVFRKKIDFGTEMKIYGHNAEGQRRYSAPPLEATRRQCRIGSPNRDMISTSHAERLNLSVRLFGRRFTRLTLGFSKKLANHRHAVALFIAHFNFCRVHSALKIKATETTEAQQRTPAMAAGLTDRIWTVNELTGALVR
jgi:transposase-like protein/IS1 family transposase